MSAKVCMTAEELLVRGHQFGPCELVEGEVVLTEPGGEEHSTVSANVSGVLRNWARKSGLGRILANEAGVLTKRDPDTVRGAEAAYVSYQRRPKGQRSTGFANHPPELIVEVIGRGQGWDAMVGKAAEYLGFGVDRVWIVDPDRRRAWVFRGDEEPCVFEEDDTLSDEQILPGFSCRVAEFFED